MGGWGGGERSRSFVKRQVSREWGNSTPPTLGLQWRSTNKSMCFFSFLNNDLCLSTIVVIIRKCNSSLALKVTHWNPVISFDYYLLIMHCICKRHVCFLLSFTYYKYFSSLQWNIVICIWKCKSYLKVLHKTLLKMLRKQKLT